MKTPMCSGQAVALKASNVAGTSGIESVIRSRTRSGGKALAPFLTAGFPRVETFVEALRIAEGCGSDVIEVGVPFSDPIADGPTIQCASQHCLGQGMTITKALEAIDKAAVSTPVVLMSYLNPLLSYGFDRLRRDALSCRVRGLIVPDLPLGQISQQPGPTNGPRRAGLSQGVRLLSGGEFDLILLSAPTTRQQRLGCIGRLTKGFLYAVTLTGVTGVRGRVDSGAVAFLRRAKASTRRPVLAGFGIASPANAVLVAAHCDGVIVGSALVEILRKGTERSALRRLGRFLEEMRRALDIQKGV